MARDTGFYYNPPQSYCGLDALPAEELPMLPLVRSCSVAIIPLSLGATQDVGKPIADRTMALTDDFSFPEFNFQHPSHQSYGSDPLPDGLDTNLYPPPSSVNSPSVTEQTPTAKNAKQKAAATADNYEEASRLAAEEDKRRRNTAASARFRVKKKQREQALEKSAKEMSEKVQALEGRINQLETENKWLKNLITERGERKQVEGEDVAALWKKYSEGVKSDDRIKGERKDGVGTKA